MAPTSTAVTIAVLLSGAAAVARAQPGPPAIQPEIPPGTVPMEIPGVGVDERFDTPVPADAVFVDHEGRHVRLGDFLDGDRPLVLALVYHSCASFCDMASRAVADVLAQQPWTVGTELEVVTLSIDPRDAQQGVLRDARARVLGRYGRAEAERGWHFLAGTEAEIRRVADAVGYRYQWDERTQQFAHPGVIMVLQPSGRVSRYLYGLEYDAADVRLALIEADAGRHASSVEQLVLYCFRWDHQDSTYVIAAWRVMRLGGLLTVFVLGGVLFGFWRRERRKPAPAEANLPSDSPASRPRET
jgi:protein SCO1/2